MKKIFIIILVGLAIRILTIVLYGDFKNDFYWEYGEIAKNIIDGKGYSLFYISDSKLEFLNSSESNPSISAYMPPGYTTFLLPFMSIDNIALRNAFIYLIHILFALIIIFLIYYLTKIYFNSQTAFFAAIITCLLPEFIYTILSFTPTVFFHFFIIIFFLITIKLDFGNVKYFYYLGIVSSIIIYFRSEFILYAFIILLLFLFRNKTVLTIKFGLIIILILSPWVIRNLSTFDGFTPLSTSFGLNLYRGNNPYEIGAWGDEIINQKIGEISHIKLESELNNIYKQEAFSYILNNPEKVVLNGFKKLFYFWIYNPTDIRTQNILYILPSMIILAFSVYGLYASFNVKKFKFIYLFIIYFHVIVLIFIPLIRYQTMMKIALIPFCSYGLNKLYVSFKKMLIKDIK